MENTYRYSFSGSGRATPKGVDPDPPGGRDAKDRQTRRIVSVGLNEGGGSIARDRIPTNPRSPHAQIFFP